MNAERVLAIIRDAGCMALGLTGIAWQQYTGNVNALLLGAYMTLLGIPVGVNAATVRRQAMRQRRRVGSGGTRASSSPQPSPSSSSGRSSPTQPASGGE